MGLITPYLTHFRLPCQSIPILRKSYLNKKEWQIPASTTSPTFMDYIIEQTKMSVLHLSFPNRDETRYLWGDVSDFELALSLRLNSYLSHHSAVYLNGLVDTPPKNIYVNQEQPPKRISPSALQQERIDLAFSKECRVSKTKARLGEAWT